MIGIAIHGAAGRMGQRLIALGSQDEEVRLTAAIESSGHPQVGQDAGLVAGVGELGLFFSPEWGQGTEAVIDFSVPAAAEAITRTCLERKIPLVMATTGLGEDQKSLIEQASHEIPVVWAPSMSTMVNLTMKLATTAAKVLKDYPGGTDVEILERHHRFKEDSPSGTALRFGDLISNAMGITNEVHGREGEIGVRPRNELAYHAIRTGDNPGEHTIVFGVLGETIELTVKASNRDCYALGAITAAKFVAKQQPGLYNMYDVLGL